MFKRYDALALVCWILPGAGLLFGPGAWWVYIIWLVVGTLVIVAVVPTDENEKEASDDGS